MVLETTIDAAGRLVIPKALRDRLRLSAGTRIYLSEDEGRIVLSPERPEPQLTERDGFLLLDLGPAGRDVDAGASRDERIRQLVDYALAR